MLTQIILVSQPSPPVSEHPSRRISAISMQNDHPLSAQQMGEVGPGAPSRASKRARPVIGPGVAHGASNDHKVARLESPQWPPTPVKESAAYARATAASVMIGRGEWGA